MATLRNGDYGYYKAIENVLIVCQTNDGLRFLNEAWMCRGEVTAVEISQFTKKGNIFDDGKKWK